MWHMDMMIWHDMATMFAFSKKLMEITCIKIVDGFFCLFKLFISSSEGSLLAFMASTHFSRSSTSPFDAMQNDAIFWIWCKTMSQEIKTESVQCPENGRSLLTVVFMSKLLLKFSASGWSTEVQKNCSPPMSAAPVKVAIYAWIVCRYAAMSLCRYAIDCSLRCLQSQLHAFLPLWWPYQLLETEIKISQMLLDTWSTMEQCESICGVLCSIKLKHLLQLVFLCLLCFFGCKFCSWGLLRTMQCYAMSRSALGVLFFAILRHGKELQWRDFWSSKEK